MIKNALKYGIVSCALVISLGVGCAQMGKVITKACDWMDTYITAADVAVGKIQADYDVMVKIVTGVIPASGPVLAQAKAWVAAADVALSVLGAVQKRICMELAEIQMALQVANQTVPKLALSQTQLQGLRR